MPRDSNWHAHMRKRIDTASGVCCTTLLEVVRSPVSKYCLYTQVAVVPLTYVFNDACDTSASHLAAQRCAALGNSIRTTERARRDYHVSITLYLCEGRCVSYISVLESLLVHRASCCFTGLQLFGLQTEYSATSVLLIACLPVSSLFIDSVMRP